MHASATLMKAAVKEFQRHLPSGWRHMVACWRLTGSGACCTARFMNVLRALLPITQAGELEREPPQTQTCSS